MVDRWRKNNKTGRNTLTMDRRKAQFYMTRKHKSQTSLHIDFSIIDTFLCCRNFFPLVSNAY